MPRSEGPFERLLRQRPDRDPAPIIIGGTIAFLALVIVLVFVASSVLGGGDDGGSGDGQTVEVAEGITGQIVPVPSLSAGLTAQSQYIEFETEKDVQAIIGLPLLETATDATVLGFYSVVNNNWERQADVELINDGSVAQGEFEIVPANLVVLQVVPGTFQVGASLPFEGSLSPDAGVSRAVRGDYVSAGDAPLAEADLRRQEGAAGPGVQIVSTRDYVPAADASVQGTASDTLPAEGTIRLPTIVGSGEDTAGIVNEILEDETKRAQHVQAIVTTVEAAGVEGIDLEYSNVDPDLGEQFTSFVSALAGTLHGADKRLSLTLPPPGDQKQAYEWDKLGEQADFLKVLPVADPVSYWETMPGALSTIAEKTDARKVWLVMSPFSIQGQGDEARTIGYLNAMVMASEAAVREPKNPEDLKPGTKVKLVASNLDEGEGASKLEWNEDSLTVSYALGGTERTRIFIENSFSVNFKLELVQAYGLGGIHLSDGSSQSDVANVWPVLRDFVTTNTTSLSRPNDASLVPGWEAPDNGSITGSGTTAEWTPDAAGQFNVVLVVSDGDRRFGQQLLVDVRTGEPTTTPSPISTFAPDTETPTPSAAPTDGATPTPTKAAGLAVEVGKVADAASDDDSIFSNNEIAEPGSEVTYLISIDNDSSIPVTVQSLVDTLYPDIEADCSGPGDNPVIGAVLAPDDGDGAGVINGGADQIQCTFTDNAPDESGEVVTNTVTGTVRDENGNVASDSDDTKVTTS